MATEHRQHEVGLLGLGRQSGGGSAALDVCDDEWQLDHHREAHRLRLETDTWTAGRGDADGTTERRSERGARGRDLVLGREGDDPEALVGGELVQDVARGGYRVAAVEERPPRLVRRRQEPERRSRIAGDVAVLARKDASRLHLV